MNVGLRPIANIPGLGHTYRMARPLYDADGELTALGERIRILALIAGIIAALALIPFGIFGMLAPMACGGGCSTVEGIGAAMLFLSPLLLLIATMSGFAASKSPTWGLFSLAAMPASAAVIVFLIAVAG